MKLRNLKSILGLLCFGLFLVACGEDVETPKSRAYPRVNYPDRAYQAYESTDCPFDFEYPTYSELNKDENFNDPTIDKSCWIDISLVPFQGDVHLSYKAINETEPLAKLLEDMHKLTSKHIVKADFIEDHPIQTENNVGGMLFELGGNTASAIQFYLTDSTDHFVRGSLYFRNTPNADSLAPIVNYVKEDLRHLINSFDWKEM